MRFSVAILFLALSLLAQAQGTCSGATSGTKGKYCDAAKGADASANASNVLWKVWSGVAGVCTTACVASITGPAKAAIDRTCQFSNYGGTGTDIAVTKQLGTQIAGLGKDVKDGVKSLGKKSTEESKEAADKAKGKDGHESCYTAATAGVQVLAKSQTASSSQETAEKNLQAAAQLEGIAATAGPVGGIQQTEPLAKLCAEANKNGAIADYSKFMECAVRSDPSLPAFVKTPEFASAFAQTTGVPLDQFLDSQTSAQSTLAAVMGAALTPEGAAKAEALVGELAKYTGAAGGAAPASAYAAAGGGNAGGGESDKEFNPADLLAGLMASLNPEDKKTAEAMAASFKKLDGRNPASLADDRSLSLFERVGYRYSKYWVKFAK